MHGLLMHAIKTSVVRYGTTRCSTGTLLLVRIGLGHLKRDFSDFIKDLRKLLIVHDVIHNRSYGTTYTLLFSMRFLAYPNH